MEWLKLTIGAWVMLVSGDTGKIVGRAEYLDQKPQYLVRYVDGSCNLTEKWWPATAIQGRISFDPPPVTYPGCKRK
jgi:hypothetical protein